MPARLTLTFVCLLAVGVVAAEESELRLATQMYASQRACKVGDILTVVIDEQVSSSSSDSIGTAKTADAKANAGVIGSEAGQRSLTRKLAQLEIPLYELGGASSFSGKGEQALSESIAARFAVRVVDVLDNGLLVVQGERKLTLKDEKVNITISGLVRPRDVAEDNMVASSRVSDAHIEYERDGAVSKGTRPGFVWRIFQFLNPW